MKWLWGLFGMSAILVFGGLLNIFLLLPTEESQGLVQKIFFIHVPSAFAFYSCLITGSVFAVLYLIERRDDYDRLSKSFVQTALLFALCVMATGPIWAKPIWGTYWTWDPRLTTMLLMTLILLGYCATRNLMEKNPEKQLVTKVVSAIIAIIATLDIVPIHYSVKLWRGVHPSVLKNADGLPSSFRLALQWMTIAFIILSVVMAIAYSKYLKNKEQLTQLMRRNNHA